VPRRLPAPQPVGPRALVTTRAAARPGGTPPIEPPGARAKRAFYRRPQVVADYDAQRFGGAGGARVNAREQAIVAGLLPPGGVVADAAGARRFAAHAAGRGTPGASAAGAGRRLRAPARGRRPRRAGERAAAVPLSGSGPAPARAAARHPPGRDAGVRHLHLVAARAPPAGSPALGRARRHYRPRQLPRRRAG